MSTAAKTPDKKETPPGPRNQRAPSARFLKATNGKPPAPKDALDGLALGSTVRLMPVEGVPVMMPGADGVDAPMPADGVTVKLSVRHIAWIKGGVVTVKAEKKGN